MPCNYYYRIDGLESNSANDYKLTTSSTDQKYVELERFQREYKPDYTTSIFSSDQLNSPYNGNLSEQNDFEKNVKELMKLSKRTLAEIIAFNWKQKHIDLGRIEKENQEPWRITW